MPVFIYTTEKNGQLIRSEIQAKTLQIAKIKLQSRKIDPLYIKEKPLIPFFSGGGKVKSSTVLFFTRQFAFLMNAGVPLIQSLDMCSDSVEDEELKLIIQGIIKQLESGRTLSHAMRARPDVFNGFYVNMIVCAEETGLLDKILEDLANYMEQAEHIKSKVKSAMMYPSIVVFISLAIVSGIIVFIVPKFEALYANSSSKLPALTQLLVNISNLFREKYALFLALIIFIPIVFIMFKRTETGKMVIQSFLKTIPMFGKIQYQSSLTRFFRSFYCLLKSGVNFLDAINVAHNIAAHPEVQRGISISKDYVTKGKSFAKGLEESQAFPPLVYYMAKIGEESGSLELSFEKLAIYYEKKLENLISGMIKMIEPIMIVFLGGLIGIIILALYLPVFNIGTTLN